jgi:hypothetical protein
MTLWAETDRFCLQENKQFASDGLFSGMDLMASLFASIAATETIPRFFVD